MTPALFESPATKEPISESADTMLRPLPELSGDIETHFDSFDLNAFLDYVADPSRNQGFYVNPSIPNPVLAEWCLHIMNSGLKRNPCNLPRYAMNSELSLDERRKRIGPQLEYACTYWISHMCEGTIPQSALDLLEIFVTKHLIQWMEVMSLVDGFKSVLAGLPEIYYALKEPTFDRMDQVSTILTWLYDGRKLASEFCLAVQASACHLYHSALPLAPETSLLHQLHADDLLSEAKVTYGRLTEWPSHENEIYEEEKCLRMEFSKDGKMLGATFEPPHNKFQMRLSRVYDVATGERLHTFIGTGICFSPDNTSAAVALSDSSAVIWNVRTGQQRIAITLPHYKDRHFEERPCALAFSPSGRYLLASNTKQIQVYDVHTGKIKWTKTEDDLVLLSNESEPDEDDSNNFSPDCGVWLQEEPPLVVVRHGRKWLGIHNLSDRSVVHIEQVATDDWYSFLFGLSIKHSILAISNEETLHLKNPYTNELYSTIEATRTGSVTFSDRFPIMLFLGTFYDISNPRSPRQLTTVPRLYTGSSLSPTQNLIAIRADPFIRIFPFEACFSMDSADITGVPVEKQMPIWDTMSHRLLTVSQDGKEVAFISESKSMKLHLADDGVNETEIRLNRSYTQPYEEIVFHARIIPFSNGSSGADGKGDSALVDSSSATMTSNKLDEGGASEGGAALKDSPSVPSGDSTSHADEGNTVKMEELYRPRVIPVEGDIVEAIGGNGEDSLRKTIINSIESGTSFEASLEIMESFGTYWQPSVQYKNPWYNEYAGRFFFTSPDKKTVVYISFKSINAGQNISIRVTLHSIPEQRRLASREWQSVGVGFANRSLNNGWITMDTETGVLTIFNSVGISGEWKLADVPEKVKYWESGSVRKYMALSRSFLPCSREEAEVLEGNLQSQLSDRDLTKVYPVISDDNGWILNHKNERILWLPVRAQASIRFRTKWRWAQDRLIVSGDVGSREVMVVDFNGVDVEGSSALQVTSKLTWGKLDKTHPIQTFTEQIGWERLIISGLNAL